jgi:outer membrane immunogenic protein
LPGIGAKVGWSKGKKAIQPGIAVRKFGVHPMKKFLIAAAGLAALAAPALAADMAPAPRAYTKAPAIVAQVYDWTGFYVGVNGGGAWGGGRSSLVNFTSDGYDLGPAFNSSGSSSWLAGVHGGYNWQTASKIVLGIEGDFEWTNLKHSNNGILTFLGLPFGTSLWSMNDSLSWLASVRGRLGYAVGNFMPYVTGGAAWSNVNYSGFVTNNIAVTITGFGPYNQTITQTGWVAGVGGEYMFAPNWIARLEYLHYGFGGQTLVGANNPTFISAAAHGVFTLGSTGYDTVRAGISYKWGGPVVAKY